MLGSTPVEPGGGAGGAGRRRQGSKVGALTVRGSSGRSGGPGHQQTEANSPLNLSVREEEPLLQLVKNTSQPMPRDASEALLSLIAKTGRDLEITRKTRKPGEGDSVERLRRGNLESSRNFSPIAPQVNFALHFLFTINTFTILQYFHNQYLLNFLGGGDASVPWQAAEEEDG